MNSMETTGITVPELITVEELAKLLRIGRNTAYGLVKDHSIKSIKVGRGIRIPLPAVDEYIRSAR